MSSDIKRRKRKNAMNYESGWDSRNLTALQSTKQRQNNGNKRVKFIEEKQETFNFV